LNIYYQPSENDELQLHEPTDDFMFRYRSLRTESTKLAPSEKPAKIMSSYKNNKVELGELSVFMAKKRTAWNFMNIFKRM